MTLWPRSLLWRTLLLIALLLRGAFRVAADLPGLGARAARAADRAADRERGQPHARRAGHRPAGQAPRAAARAVATRRHPGLSRRTRRKDRAAARPARPAPGRGRAAPAPRAGDPAILLAQRHARLVGELQHRRRRVLGDAAARAARAQRSSALARPGRGGAPAGARRRLSDRVAHQPPAARTHARRRPDRAGQNAAAGGPNPGHRKSARCRTRSTRWPPT